MTSVYQACCIFHIISISFNFSDTALRVAKPMIGAKVIIFFSPCLLCFQRSRQNLSPGSSAFSHLLRRAQNPLMNPGGLEIGLRKRTSPFNRANLKRHLIWSRFLNIAWPLSRRDMFMIYILYLLIICRPLVKRKIPSFFLIKFGEFLGSLGTINPRTYKGGGRDANPPVRFF